MVRIAGLPFHECRRFTSVTLGLQIHICNPGWDRLLHTQAIWYNRQFLNYGGASLTAVCRGQL